MSRQFLCTYDYTDELGVDRFQRVKWRLDPAEGVHTKVITYRWRRSPTHVWVPRMTLMPEWDRYKHLIYNLPAVVGAVQSGETIWWPEGEGDADSLIALGKVATTHHGGAGKTSREQAAWFAGHRGRVALLFDRDKDDERGGNPGAMDLVKRYDALRAAGVSRSQISVGHALTGKDITDHLAAGHSLDKVVWLSSLSELRAKAVRTNGSTLRRAGYRPGDG